MAAKISHRVVLQRAFLLMVVSVGVFFSSYVEGANTPSAKKKEETSSKKTHSKKHYVPLESVFLYKSRLFVFYHNKLFNPKTIHEKGHKIYIKENELGAVLGKVVLRRKGHETKARVFCAKCEESFKDFPSIYKHLYKSSPCSKA